MQITWGKGKLANPTLKCVLRTVKEKLLLFENERKYFAVNLLFSAYSQKQNTVPIGYTNLE